MKAVCVGFVGIIAQTLTWVCFLQDKTSECRHLSDIDDS